MEEKERYTEQEKTRSGVSRREFITGTIGSAAALGAVVGVTSLVPPVSAASSEGVAKAPGTAYGLNAARPQVPSKWTYSSDVVIVGYGGAGAFTAISAFDAGANVLILEKTPSLASLGIANNKTPETQISGGGGNMRICGGNIDYCADPIAATTFFYYTWFGQTPMKVCQAMATMYAQNGAYMKSLGLNYPGSPRTVEYQSVWPGGNQAGWVVMTAPGAGRQFFYDLDQLVTVKRGIPVLFNTRATDLIQNPATGEILGVQALQNLSQVVTVQAKKAVILTTGGFEFDSVMKANYAKMSPIHFGGWQYNTGDGVKMALKVGAGLWHMASISARLGTWEPTHNTGGGMNNLAGANGWIWTDRYGNRFTNESSVPSHSAWMVLTDWNFNYGEYTRVPSMWVFDSTKYKAGPVFGCEGGINNGINALPVQLGGWGANGSYTGSAVGTAWTNDALVAAGYMFQGKDIPTLAANIASAKIIGSNQGMATPPGWNAIESMDAITEPAGNSCPHFSAANLTAALNQWNADCAAGKGDTVFGRAASSMAPINAPPYYALPLWPEGPNTNGGPIRNEKAQVCDPDYNPIPRLYSAGELGSVYGQIYSGSNNGESLAFGRIAANNAATEAPWS